MKVGFPLSFKDSIFQYVYTNNGLIGHMYGKDIAHSDKLAENYHPTLHFPSAVAQRVLASFHSWLWFESPQLLCFDSLSMLSSALFLHLSKQLFAINLKCGCSSVMCLQLISAAPVWPKNLWIQVLNKLMCGHR